MNGKNKIMIEHNAISEQIGFDFYILDYIFISV